MTERRLSPADAMWLYSEWDRNPQTVSCMMWMDREIDPERLRDIINSRLVEKYPTFHQRIRKSRNPLFLPHWENDPDFSIDNHLEVVDLPAPGDKPALESLVSQQRSTMLDHQRPLWKVYLIQGYLRDGTPTSAVHTRVQHSIADGWALVRLVLSLADETSPAEAPKVIDKKRPRKREIAGKAVLPAVGAVDAVKQTAGTLADTAGRAAGAVVSMVKQPSTIPAVLATGQDALEETLSVGLDPKRFVEFTSQVPAEAARRWGRMTGTAETISQVNSDAIDFLLAPRPGKTILHGAVSGSKKVTWMDPIPLEPIKQAGKTYGATINDVLLACLTNALRNYLLEKDALNVEELFTAMPVSLRKPDAPLPRTLGNRFGLVPVLLPVGIADPVEQVRSIKAQIDELKSSQMPVVSFGLMSASALATPEVERLIHKVNQDHSIGVTTNVPGPRLPLELAGAKVLGAWGMGGLSGNMNLSFGIFSLAGELNFSVHSDTAITPDPERILDHFQEAVHTLIARAALADS